MRILLLLTGLLASSLALPVPPPQGDLGEGPPKVAVALYYEALCPSCRNFVAGVLPGVVADLSEIMTLALYPYGNAKLNAEGNVTCQHGPDECKANMIQACLLNFVPAKEALPAIKCMEKGLFPPQSAGWWCILRKAPFPSRTWPLVQDCLNTRMGYELTLLEAKATMELNPPHTFTPWVTINGAPALKDHDSVGKLVCEAYTGPKPAACNKYTDPGAAPLARAVSEGGEGGGCALGDEGDEGGGRGGAEGNVTILYSKCATAKVLGEVCMYLYRFDVNMTLGVILELPKAGFEINVVLGAEPRECMTDADLLVLLDLIPELAPYRKEIEKIIQVRGFIPGEIYSECVRLYNVTTGPAKGEISGCLALDSNLMCWKKKCLHKGTTNFGCFHHNGTHVQE